jgi:prepilin-type N-terminal cleavage/methylation domain-containing protein
MQTYSKGFTFLEVLVVMIIIAIFIAIGVSSNLGKESEKARVAKTIEVIKKLSYAINVYNEDTGYYPSSAKQLWKNDLSVEGWKGPYVKPPYLDYTYSYFPKMPYNGEAYIECKDGSYVALKMQAKKAFCSMLDKRVDDGDLNKGRVIYDNSKKACYYYFDKGDYITCK